MAYPYQNKDPKPNTRNQHEFGSFYPEELPFRVCIVKSKGIALNPKLRSPFVTSLVWTLSSLALAFVFFSLWMNAWAVILRGVYLSHEYRFGLWENEVWWLRWFVAIFLLQFAGTLMHFVLHVGKPGGGPLYRNIYSHFRILPVHLMFLFRFAGLGLILLCSLGLWQFEDFVGFAFWIFLLILLHGWLDSFLYLQWKKRVQSRVLRLGILGFYLFAGFWISLYQTPAEASLYSTIRQDTWFRVDRYYPVADLSDCSYGKKAGFVELDIGMDRYTDEPRMRYFWEKKEFDPDTLSVRVWLEKRSNPPVILIGMDSSLSWKQLSDVEAILAGAGIREVMYKSTFYFAGYFDCGVYRRLQYPMPYGAFGELVETPPSPIDEESIREQNPLLIKLNRYGQILDSSGTPVDTSYLSSFLRTQTNPNKVVVLQDIDPEMKAYQFVRFWMELQRVMKYYRESLSTQEKGGRKIIICHAPEIRRGTDSGFFREPY